MTSENRQMTIASPTDATTSARLAMDRRMMSTFSSWIVCVCRVIARTAARRRASCRDPVIHDLRQRTTPPFREEGGFRLWCRQGQFAEAWRAVARHGGAIHREPAPRAAVPDHATLLRVIECSRSHIATVIRLIPSSVAMSAWESRRSTYISRSRSGTWRPVRRVTSS
jgi:hypothetical protein